jgi:FAD binding domain-containing protein/D-arabinono-1,4-lactone oxidase
MTIWNWNDSARCAPAEVVAPWNLQELVDVVTSPSRYPSPVRAVGEMHSLNESFTTTGTVVLMRHFDAIGEPQNGTITVGAGVRMIDLNRKLKHSALQLEVVPEIGNATAGSVACCGTKDSSLGPAGLGQISSTVVGVRMVDAEGRLVHVTDPARLREIRSSYGLFGVIYEVSFALHPRKKVRYRYASLSLDPLPAFSEVLGGADGFLGFLLPFRRQLIVERRTVVPPDTSTSAIDRLRLWLRTVAWTSGARPGLPVPFTFLTETVNRWLIGLWIWLLDHGLRWFFLALLGRSITYRADAMIDFKRSRATYFDFTFWAFPVSTWASVVPAYLDFCETFRRRTGFRPALPTEVYFIRRDDQALLSFSPTEDIFTLDLVDSIPRVPEDMAYWRWMNREYNDFAARQGARPLLNQTKELSRAIVHRALDHDWARFVTLREQADPDQRFLNEFFNTLL